MRKLLDQLLRIPLAVLLFFIFRMFYPGLYVFETQALDYLSFGLAIGVFSVAYMSAAILLKALFHLPPFSKKKTTNPEGGIAHE